MKPEMPICSKHGSIISDLLKNNAFTANRRIRRCPHMLFLIRCNCKMVKLHAALFNMESEHLSTNL